MVAVSTVIYTTMSLYFFSRNRKRRAGREDQIMTGKTEEEVAEMGDENPKYVFTY